MNLITIAEEKKAQKLEEQRKSINEVKNLLLKDFTRLSMNIGLKNCNVILKDDYRSVLPKDYCKTTYEQDVILYGFEAKWKFHFTDNADRVRIYDLYLKVPIVSKFLFFKLKEKFIWIDFKDVIEFVDIVREYMPERLHELENI
jgi:hypothetical protein